MTWRSCLLSDGLFQSHNRMRAWTSKVSGQRGNQLMGFLLSCFDSFLNTTSTVSEEEFRGEEEKKKKEERLVYVIKYRDKMATVRVNHCAKKKKEGGKLEDKNKAEVKIRK
ncbi:hypothetical protein CEXT_178491 [Caerostris extrusa]|uniref:Uncharacterized protein n=1 Tax=Caerostris extrusa TaxID=172846 RepID=A0AAV4TGH6_CAEEX|nr:hypothetical protein CEXT_178491 [Caerostris extrusa]